VRSRAGALALRPGDSPARALRAELLLDRGQLEEAEAALRDLLDEADGEAEAAVGLAKIALARRSPREALALLRQALTRRPESTEIQYLLGQAHAALGERDLAARYLEALPAANLLRQPVGVEDPWLREVQALAVGSRAHSRGAALAAARENYRLALVEFDQALAADPDLLPPRFGKAIVYVQLGEREAAIAELRGLLARQPDHADGLELLGAVLASSGEAAEAESTLRRALVLDPLAERALVDLAQLERATGRLEEALDDYRRALETAPAMGEAHFGQVITLLALGRHDEARAELERARRALPGDRTLAILAARWQAAAPRPAERDAAQALAAARELAAHGLELPLAETFAMAHAAAGDFARAARWQEAALAARAGPETASWLAERLALYRKGRPCLTPWRSDEVWLRSAVVAPEAPI
jgi:tetratricopeptide (TPR) repeat protein